VTILAKTLISLSFEHLKGALSNGLGIAFRQKGTPLHHVSRGQTTMSKKVLLVDDSTTTLMMEEMILKQSTQYECVTAKDGLDAISRAVVEEPDLVLMDVVMPRMNGFEACKRMRLEDSLRETPIILVTTRGEEEYVEAGFQSGCNDYITKPINSFELVTLLKSYLGE
jgi:CheY-like chemotaxis protein